MTGKLADVCIDESTFDSARDDIWPTTQACLCGIVLVGAFVICWRLIHRFNCILTGECGEGQESYETEHEESFHMHCHCDLMAASDPCDDFVADFGNF